jgi:hypothetical protein
MSSPVDRKEPTEWSVALAAAAKKIEVQKNVVTHMAALEALRLEKLNTLFDSCGFPGNIKASLMRTFEQQPPSTPSKLENLLERIRKDKSKSEFKSKFKTREEKLLHRRQTTGDTSDIDKRLMESRNLNDD